jgi:DinB superfamily
VSTGHTGAPLDLHDVTVFLRNTPVLLRNLLEALPGGAVAWHPRAGEWCIKEVVGHLLEEDKRDFVGRIRLILDQDEPRLAVNDQEEVARTRRDCDRTLDELLDEFRTVRGASVSFVSTLKAADLHRAGVHPNIGHLEVTNVLHEWIYHDLNHLSQIGANVQSLLWAHLGNMQRFYQS